jgi:hypothetical protein
LVLLQMAVWGWNTSRNLYIFRGRKRNVKANSQISCRSPAALIHTCHAATLPFSNSVVSFVKVRVVDGRSRTRAGRPHAVSGRPILIHTYPAVPMPRCAVALKGRFQNGMVVAWHGNDMTCVNQTRPHCVNQVGNTQYKLLAERHGICELA